MPGAFQSRNTREAITSRLRLRSHDYREPGPYFVTICVQHRQCLFGTIRDSEMTFSEAGKMIDACWQRIPERFPSVEPGGHVVMPNHLHGIVTLTSGDDGQIRDDAPSLSDVIHWFKRQTIRLYGDGVRHQGWNPYDGRLWQSGFMEHVVRTDREMDRLSRYVENNVASWEDDAFHPDAVRQ